MMRTVAALLICLLTPLAGCLASPCSEHDALCDGSGPDDGPTSCEALPLVVSADLSDDEGDATDVWALRVTPEFERLQVLGTSDGWEPIARLWRVPESALDGDDECACVAGACPLISMSVESAGWLFVEVWDYDDDESATRSYTLNANGVTTAILVRDGVDHADQPLAYGTTPPGPCSLDSVGSDVQLPWLSEVEPNDSDPYQDLGELTPPGLCIQATMSYCSDQDRFSLIKVGDTPLRLEMHWDGGADLDVNMIPGGSAFTQNNPEVILGSVQDGTEFSVEVSCASAPGPVPYVVTLEPY